MNQLYQRLGAESSRQERAQLTKLRTDTKDLAAQIKTAISQDQSPKMIHDKYVSDFGKMMRDFMTLSENISKREASILDEVGRDTQRALPARRADRRLTRPRRLLVRAGRVAARSTPADGQGLQRGQLAGRRGGDGEGNQRGCAASRPAPHSLSARRAASHRARSNRPERHGEECVATPVAAAWADAAAAVNTQVAQQGVQVDQVERNTNSAAANVESGTAELSTVRATSPRRLLTRCAGSKARECDPEEEAPHCNPLYHHLPCACPAPVTCRSRHLHSHRSSPSLLACAPPAPRLLLTHTPSAASPLLLTPISTLRLLVTLQIRCTVNTIEPRIAGAAPCLVVCRPPIAPPHA